MRKWFLTWINVKSAKKLFEAAHAVWERPELLQNTHSNLTEGYTRELYETHNNPYCDGS
jgi:hypothetical protein